MSKISYQGTVASFSHQVCQVCYPDGSYYGCRTFADAIHLVHEGETDYAIIPVENSTTGRVMEIYNMLPEAELHIIKEYLLPTNYCLMMPTRSVRQLPKGELSDKDLVDWKNTPPTEEEIIEARKNVNEIHSHPQGLAQCTEYLKKNYSKAVQCEVWDTAGAARDVTSLKSRDVAAIAPEMATLFGLTILDRHIEDIPSNTTRFIVLAREGLDPQTISEPSITTLIFETLNVSGALVRALRVFDEANINMTKLESYMVGPKHSQPRFQVDIVANPCNPQVDKALQSLKLVTQSLKVLGTYPASPGRGKETGYAAV